MKIHFSSKKHDWETPKDFFDVLNTEFEFTLDAAANNENYKLDNFFTKEDDALSKEWEGRVFCNPPYGRELGKWVKKAYEESLKDYCELVVLLIPSRTDTSYWHDFIFNKACEIRFIKGRLKFEFNGQVSDPAPFPSAVIVFKNGVDI